MTGKKKERKKKRKKERKKERKKGVFISTRLLVPWGMRKVNLLETSALYDYPAKIRGGVGAHCCGGFLMNTCTGYSNNTKRLLRNISLNVHNNKSFASMCTITRVECAQ